MKSNNQIRPPATRIKHSIIIQVFRLLAVISEYIPRPPAYLELDVNRILNGCSLRVVEFEELFILVETKHPSKEISRERFALGIEVADDTIVEPTGCLNLILGIS